MLRPLALSLLLLGLPALAATPLTRGPFLQQTSSTGTTVVVNTGASARVQVEAEGAGQRVQSAPTTGTRHTLQLTGLQPATVYRYAVTVDGAQAGGGAFRTPGLPGTAGGRQSVIGLVGDMGSGGTNEKANAAQLAKRGVELLLTVGDNSYPEGAPAEWDPKFFQPFASLLPNTTLAPTLGDHEYLTPGATGYLDAFVLPAQPGGERYYAFDWGDVHVAVLDSNCVDPVDAATTGCDGAKMMAWLREDLRQTRAAWKLVTMHRPAVASGRYGHSAKVAAAVIPVAEAMGVDLVIQGHNHFYERTWPLKGGQVVKRSYESAGAPVYVTSGGGGDWVYDSPPSPPAYSAFRATAYQHLQLTLDGGRLKVDSVRPDGSVLDSFTLTKSLPPPTKPPPADGGTPGGGTPAPDGGAGAPDGGSPVQEKPDPLTGGEAGCDASGLGGTVPAAALAMLLLAIRWARLPPAPAHPGKRRSSRWR